MHRLRSDRSLHALLGILGVVGAVLVATSVDGVFVADENQYLSFATAVRQGRVTVPGTEDLPPALGLAYFDPTDPTPKPVPERFRLPVRYSVSPLHAFLAAPLTVAGWKGLVALNVFGFCLAAVFVFLLARRFAGRPSTPWVAVGVYLLAGFSVEYAQAVWPHMLSAGLCAGSVYFAAAFRDGAKGRDAVLAGFLAGLAFGVRLQALLVVTLVGLGLVLLTERRMRTALLYALGLVVPLLACSLVHHAARGSWNPIMRGSGYISVESGGVGLGPLIEWSLSLWARVFDYSAYPELPGARNAFMIKEPFSGATLLAGSFRKAWLQSAPWVAIALASLVVAWRRPFSRTDGRTRELRAIGLLVFPVLLALATRGLVRHDGLSYNQRYLLDLMPLMAVALAWAVEGLGWRGRASALGIGVGLGLYGLAYHALPLDLGLALAMKAPLLLAIGLSITWLLARRAASPAPVAAALVACLTWATLVHLFDDVAASRRLRTKNEARLEAMRGELRDGDALFAFWGDKDAFGPLQLDKDLLIVDRAADEPATLRRLTEALLERERRVLVLSTGPEKTIAALSSGFATRVLGPFPVEGQPPLRLLELSLPRPVEAVEALP